MVVDIRKGIGEARKTIRGFAHSQNKVTYSDIYKHIVEQDWTQETKGDLITALRGAERIGIKRIALGNEVYAMEEALGRTQGKRR